MSRVLLRSGLAAIPLAGACGLTTIGSGTAVGNPTDMAAHAAPGASLSWEQATARVATATYTTCGGAREVRTVDADLDLLGATTLEVPAGEWCRFGLAFSSPLTLAGRTAAGEPFSFALVVAAVEVVAPAAVPTERGPFVLELGEPDWIAAEDVATGAPGAGRLVELADVIRTRSSLYRDPDGSGDVDDDERQEGIEATADDEADDDGDDTAEDDAYGS